MDESGLLFLRTLLVEDDPSHSLLIQRALEPVVDSVEIARTVAEAREKLLGHHYDLVVTDLSLPDSDGVTHVKDFQEIQEGVPVVVLTVTTRIENVVSAMRFGAKDFILKSFESDFRELLRLSLARVHASLKLEQERKKLQVAIENSDDGLALVSRDGRVGYWNRAYQLFFSRCGGNAENLFSFDIGKVAHGTALQHQLGAKLKSLSGNAVWNTEVVLSGDEFRAYGITVSGLDSDLARAGFEQVGVERGVTPPLSKGREEELVVWVRDITEMKRRERFQRELLATTTHDLKGPMGAIITGAEIVSGLVRDHEKASQLLLRVQSAAHGVVNLIDEFLSARRIEEGSLVLRPSTQSVAKLLQETEANYQTIADSRGIQLSFSCPADLELQVDKIGFLRVMGNLLSNALKFTPREGVVEVKAYREADGDLCVLVTDTGSGIEAAELSRIFDRYARLDRHREVSGTGLGLFVVKSIVDAHGGSIQVESEMERGTRFTLYFPSSPPVNERGELISLVFSDEEREEAREAT
jgi:signal transduction histidine kinase/ActR/RegA family two-component response regulator